jgi:large subunit ribosomal protein L24
MRRIWKGDKVAVVSGAIQGMDDEHSVGTVLSVDPAKNLVYVEGVNLRKVAQRRSATVPGGIVEKEGGVHTSNVELVSYCDNHLKDINRKRERLGLGTINADEVDQGFTE